MDKAIEIEGALRRMAGMLASARRCNELDAGALESLAVGLRKVADVADAVAARGAIVEGGGSGSSIGVRKMSGDVATVIALPGFWQIERRVYADGEHWQAGASFAPGEVRPSGVAWGHGATAYEACANLLRYAREKAAVKEE